MTAAKPTMTSAKVGHGETAMWTDIHGSCVEVVLPTVAVPMVAQADTVPAVPAISGVGISHAVVPTAIGRTAGYGRKYGYCRHVSDLPHYLFRAHGMIFLLSVAIACDQDEVYQPFSQCGRHASGHVGQA
jgi:hypothetical protein